MSTEQVIRALKRLEKNWPDGLWLFATGNTLHLMATHPSGIRTASGELNDGMDPALIKANFNIPNDGGDW